MKGTRANQTWATLNAACGCRLDIPTRVIAHYPALPASSHRMPFIYLNYDLY